MDEQSRENRIYELKLKSKRKNICLSINNTISDVDTNSFISINDTIEMSNKIYEKIDSLNNQVKIGKEAEVNISAILDLKKDYQSYNSEYGVLFHEDDRECGALMLKVSDFFDNISMIFDLTAFSAGRRDLIFVDKDFKFGICIERFEYYNCVSNWREIDFR